MNTEDTGTDDLQGIEDVYEANLFEYVLRHVSKDSSLEPRINNAISLQLFEDERYAQYYGKVQQLYAQGLFNDSFSYADYLSSIPQDTTEEETEDLSQPDIASEKTAVSEGPPKGKQVSMTTFLSAVASLVIAFSVAFVFLNKENRLSNDESSLAVLGNTPKQDNPGAVTNELRKYHNDIKTLGSDPYLTTYDIGRLNVADLEIKHNSVLLKEEGDMKQCNMQLVFKSVTEDGFLARSKNLGKGDEDPFLEDLEVRFPDSEGSAEVVKYLEDQLNERQFPECIVQGIHIKPKQRLHSFNNLSVVLINDIVILKSAE